MFARLLALPDRIAVVVERHAIAWRIAFAAVILLVLAFTAARYVQKASKPSDLNTYTRTAFLRWRPQILELEVGENIYVKHNYPNPPVMALVLLPLMDVDLPLMDLDPLPLEGAVTWLVLKMALLPIMVLWAIRLCGGLRFPAAALAVILAAHPLLGDLSHGNVNIFIAFLVLAGLELYRRGWDVSAGLALGLAIACKVTPALFLPYFGWHAVQSLARESEPVARIRAFCRGGGKVLLGAAVGLILFLFVVPAAWMATRHDGDAAEKLRAGWAENRTLLESWFDGMVKPFLIDGKITSVHANQSIPGVVNRVLTHEPSEVDYDEETGRERPKEYHNLADIGPGGAKRVVQVCQLAFVLLIVLLCRTDATRTRQGLAVAAECGLIVLGMLLFSERTWKHHGTGLILPVAAIVGLWAARPSGPRTRWFVALVLASVTALTLVPSLLGGRAQDLALTYGTHTAAYLLLTAAVAAVLWQAHSVAVHSLVAAAFDPVPQDREDTAQTQ